MFMRHTVLRILKASGLFALSRWLTRDQLRILCYHGIWLGGPPHFGDCLFMDTATFSGRLDLIKRLGYPIVELDDALTGLESGTLPAAAVVITIDDAWQGTYSAMVPELDRRGMPATLYVTTYYVIHQKPVLNVLIGFMVQRAGVLPTAGDLFPGEPSFHWPIGDREAYAKALVEHIDAIPTLNERWRTIERIAPRFGLDFEALMRDKCFHLMDEDALRDARRRGIDIQLHTHSHRMHDFDAEALEREMTLNRMHLSRILDAAPAGFTHFCYPSGVYDESVFATLEQCGVRSATTTDFGLNSRDANRYALKRILDCQSMTELELEAKLCGFWSLLQAAKRRLRLGTH